MQQKCLNMKPEIIHLCEVSGLTRGGTGGWVWTDILNNVHYFEELTNSMAPDPEGSPPLSQKPATSPHYESDKSTPYPQPISLKIHFDPILHLCLGLPNNVSIMFCLN